MKKEDEDGTKGSKGGKGTALPSFRRVLEDAFAPFYTIPLWHNFPRTKALSRIAQKHNRRIQFNNTLLSQGISAIGKPGSEKELKIRLPSSFFPIDILTDI